MEQEINQLEQDRNKKSIFVSILKFIGFMVVALAPMLIVGTLIGMQSEFSTLTNSILGVLYIVLSIFIIIFLWKKYKKYSKEKIQKIGLRDIGFALLFFLIARVIAIVGTLLITMIYGSEMTANDEALMALTGPSADSFVFFSVLFILSISIIVPITEELTFRGIGTNLLFKKQSFWLPLIITSTIFGLLHTPTDIISFLLYGFLGVVFFLAYYRRKNILDAILVHILNNSLAGIVFLLELLGLVSL
ncbi:hypothetical protein BTS2_3730 [Bacillus sp. TS-2]|nr:hypothetical protein BTS2_3730 [Bacillus sp. TS-2]